MNRNLLKRGQILRINEYVEIYLISVKIRKMQSQAITKCSFVFIWTTPIKNSSENDMHWLRFRDLKLLCVISRYINMIHHVENSVAVLQKVKRRYTIGSRSSISKKEKNAIMWSKNSTVVCVSTFIAELYLLMKMCVGETLYLTING